MSWFQLLKEEEYGLRSFETLQDELEDDRAYINEQLREAREKMGQGDKYYMSNPDWAEFSNAIVRFVKNNTKYPNRNSMIMKLLELGSEDPNNRKGIKNAIISKLKRMGLS